MSKARIAEFVYISLLPHKHERQLFHYLFFLIKKLQDMRYLSCINIELI